MPTNHADAYTRCLAAQVGGYANPYPEPEMTLPDACKREGTCVGDLGYIDSDGTFMYLLNLLRPRDDPVNREQDIPTWFRPVQLGSTGIRQFRRYRHGQFEMSSKISSKGLLLDVQPELLAAGLPVTAGPQLEFTSSKKEGAILVYPEGASTYKLNSRQALASYLADTAVDWYRFFNEELGYSISNGALYAVTECDKTTSWGMASFYERSNGVSLGFSLTVPGFGASALSSSWSGSTGHGVNTATGPGNNIGENTVENQCTVIRGFRASVQKRFFSRGPGSSVRINGESGRNNWIPFSTFHGERFATPNPGRRQFNFGARRDGANSSDTSESEDEVCVTPLVYRPPQPYHPLVDINNRILDRFPAASAVVTHDEHWSSLLSPDESTVPSSHILWERFMANYMFVQGLNNTVTLEDSIPLNEMGCPPTSHSPLDTPPLSQDRATRYTRRLPKREKLLRCIRRQSGQIESLLRRLEECEHISDSDTAISAQSKAVYLPPDSHVSLAGTGQPVSAGSLTPGCSMPLKKINCSASYIPSAPNKIQAPLDALSSDEERIVDTVYFKRRSLHTECDMDHEHVEQCYGASRIKIPPHVLVPMAGTGKTLIACSLFVYRSTRWDFKRSGGGSPSIEEANGASSRIRSYSLPSSSRASFIREVLAWSVCLNPANQVTHTSLGALERPQQTLGISQAWCTPGKLLTSLLGLASLPYHEQIVPGSWNQAISVLPVWSTDTGHLIARRLTAPNDWIINAKCTPDGAQKKSVWIPQAWRTSEESSIVSFDLAFLSDRTQIVSGSRDQATPVLLAWSTGTGDLVARPLTAHNGWIINTTLTPHGVQIVSAPADDAIIALNGASGDTNAGPFRERTHGVQSVAFSPDGTRIVSWLDNGTIRVWHNFPIPATSFLGSLMPTRAEPACESLITRK